MGLGEFVGDDACKFRRDSGVSVLLLLADGGENDDSRLNMVLYIQPILGTLSLLRNNDNIENTQRSKIL
jgi:hypothetical protein